jgi:hypothetical protein
MVADGATALRAGEREELGVGVLVVEHEPTTDAATEPPLGTHAGHRADVYA